MRSCVVACLSFLLIVPTSAAEKTHFTSKYHQVSAQIPYGWDQVQGVRGNTVLKLARTGPREQRARVAIVFDSIPEGRIARGFDIWNMTDEEIRKAESKPFYGEPVTLLNYGRGGIDGFHFVWSKTKVLMPSKIMLWRFTYSGIRDQTAITIRLTTYGDEEWFNANQAVFADFVRKLKLSRI